MNTCLICNESVKAERYCPACSALPHRDKILLLRLADISFWLQNIGMKMGKPE